MGIDWTTFVLEIVNFLVLVWILKRFLYKPVLDVLTRRRAAVESDLDRARQAEERAAGLQAQYENRLADWEKEKQSARADFEAGMGAERAKARQRLSAELEAERAGAAAREERRRQKQRHEAEIQAMDQANHFVRDLLSRLAGPELEAILARVFARELAELPEDRLAGLKSAARQPEAGIEVVSAFALSPRLRQDIETALADRIGLSLPARYAQDPTLLSGLRVSLGDWRMSMNLADELDFFTTAADHAG